MELSKAIILGLVQGLTEFLPVSSSGHLVLVSELLSFHGQGVAFNVCVHLGTLFAVVLAFRTEFVAMFLAPLRFVGGNRDTEVRHSLLWLFYIFIATLPVAVVGLGCIEHIEKFFRSTSLTLVLLSVTGIMMIAVRFIAEGEKPLSWKASLIIGCAQAVAVLPGISRSGATIFAALLVGIPRQRAARFSFLLSVPAILGAAVLQIREFLATPPDAGAVSILLTGALVSAVSGYLAIRLLLEVVRKNRLHWFGYYCLLLAGLGLVLYS